ncbi:MAG: ROK family protein [Bacteroidetes bacterium]|nr:MAG: ROK family protein [Bacteroidota bacterium]TAG89705.1 MAG: ROK family protein [Bacteroidota bacterium]
MVVLGIDIGGTTTTIGFVNENGEILAESVMPTQGKDHITKFLPRLFEQINTLKNNSKEKIELKGIGVGAPNANFFKGTIENPPNLQWGGVIPFADLLEKEYKVPVKITNDANAAAIGEMLFGAAKGMKNFILITLGTGLGSGIVIDGKLVYGQTGFAGELGHLTVKPDGRLCGCGKKGCLETYVSVTGIRRTVSKLLADMTEESQLREVSQTNLTGEMITDAALRGDRIALQAFEYTGDILGQKLADTIAFSSPEAIIFFGGLANAKDLIFQPTLKSMEKFIFPIFKGTVRLMLSELQNKNAAVLGAAALIWNELK